MRLGPILSRELLTTSRRGRFYATRFGIGAVILLILVINIAEQTERIRDASEGNQLALGAFAIISGVSLGAVLMLTPGLVSGVVVDERQRKTLDYLLASPLSSLEIIAGKLASRMLHLLSLALLGVPIQAILLLYGGINPLLIPIAFGEILAAAWFLGTLSIWVSVGARNPKEAYSRAAGLMALWMSVPAFLRFVFPVIPFTLGSPWLELRGWVLEINEWISPCNPIVGIVETLQAFMGGNIAGATQAYCWTVGEQLLFGVFFFVMAVVRLRPSYAKVETQAAKVPWHKRQVSLIPRKPPIGDNPVFWKEAYCRSVALPARFTGWVFSAGALAFVGWGLWDFGFDAYRETWESGLGQGSENHRQAFNLFVRVSSSVLAFIWVVALSSQIATTITTEAERDSWTSLIATPMSGKEIVWGKILGTLWILRGVPIGIGILWLLGLTSGSLHPIGILLALVVLAGMTIFGAAIAMFASLTQKTTTRAQSLASSIIFGIYIGVWMCCGMFGSLLWGRTFGFPFGVCQPAVFGFVQATWQQWSEFLQNGIRENELETFPAWAMVCCLGHFAIAALLCAQFESAFTRLADRPRRPMFGDRLPPPNPAADPDFDAAKKKSEPDRLDS